jgi:small-conductance mechanosensitive channel
MHMKLAFGPSLLLLLALAPAALAAEGDPVAPRGEAVLRFENRDIVTLRATIAGGTPAERVATIARRLEAIEPRELGAEFVAQQIKLGSQQGVAFYLGKKLLFGILQGDIDPLSDDTLDRVAEGAKTRLAAALKARAERLSPRAMVRGVAYTLAATAAVALGAWGLLALRRWLHSRIAALADEPLSWLVVRGVDMRAQARLYLRGVLSAAWWILLLLLLYLWTAFVLDQFPYTQPWGAALASRMWSVVTDLALSALGAIPGIFTVVVIISATLFITRLVSAFFIAVERGRVRFAGLHPETASATRRIALTLIWLFGVAFAYPFLPGAGSQVFQGISILAGLMLTLGSAGLVNQAMNGLVLVYSRALAKDEYVRIGEVEGTVTEVGSLSTKLQTPENEEVTIPNSVVVSSQIKNYSRLADSQNATITASVTISYDAPWRQVEAMLFEAARRTRGIKAQPAPRVLQRSLADFYVAYELIAPIEDPRLRPTVMSELLGNIQDQFNEHGVQILSPHFMQQPDKPALVPKEKWFAAPAAPKKDGGR